MADHDDGAGDRMRCVAVGLLLAGLLTAAFAGFGSLDIASAWCFATFDTAALGCLVACLRPRRLSLFQLGVVYECASGLLAACLSMLAVIWAERAAIPLLILSLSVLCGWAAVSEIGRRSLFTPEERRTLRATAARTAAGAREG
ncbi:hypothetical protein [Methylobacterium sp. A54F]